MWYKLEQPALDEDGVTPVTIDFVNIDSLIGIGTNGTNYFLTWIHGTIQVDQTDYNNIKALMNYTD